jgi:hypothetical protein
MCAEISLEIGDHEQVILNVPINGDTKRFRAKEVTLNGEKINVILDITAE